MNFDLGLEGKRVLVSGGTKGVGAAVEVEGEGRLVDRLRANPEVQQSAQGAKYRTTGR